MVPRAPRVQLNAGSQHQCCRDLRPLSTSACCENAPARLCGRVRGRERDLIAEALQALDQAPFDAILVAAAPQHVPAPLLEQLAPGGRLVIPVGSDLDHQNLELWRKDPRTGRCHGDVLMGVRFVPLVPTLH